jgi:hypothetical protein
VSPAWACVALIAWSLIQVPSAQSIIRLGPTGNRLSADDLAQIARLARENGGEAWVVVAYPPPFDSGARWYATVFIGPSNWKSDLNLGKTLSIVAALNSPTAYEGQKTWRVDRVGQYAQVPVPGSDPRFVPGGRDLNRPFPVAGSVDEEALKAIVSLIRSSPTVQPPKSTTGQPVAPIFTKVNGQWPIARVLFRDSAAAEVSLTDERPAEKSGQSVTLRKTATGWSVQGLSYWIAD